ncbi:uncharacterized protein C7orf50 homolog isoform X1 [Nothobranchius furzeri]|uniref:uncharacterized protein C7orf50 homolog isoform X1 n=1 Tax=Nothobranchius furzeri TaxID=105023 RepID=UPI003904BDBA
MQFMLCLPHPFWRPSSQIRRSGRSDDLWAPRFSRLTAAPTLQYRDVSRHNSPYTPSRSLRSNDQSLLVVQRTRLKTKGDRSSAAVAPRLWNSLPLSLRSVVVHQYPDPSSCPKLTCEPEGAQDLSPEERRVLERKMKKIRKKEEKKRLKKEGQTTLKTQDVGPSASKQAQDYLTCWAENRSAWKFQKIRQTWLLQHMFDSEKVSDEKFPVLLQYLEGLCGGSKDTTVQKALSLVEESGKAPDDAVVQQRAHRAREVIQLLS